MPGLAAAAGLSQPAAPGDPDRRLLSTGQVSGFRGNLSEAADGNTDDGDLQRGRAFDYVLSERYPPETQADNLVLDRNTGLMWIRDLSRLDAPDAQGPRANHRLDRSYPWNLALEVAQDLRYAGYDDWRLPNVNELQTLVDFGSWAPALHRRAFPEPLEGLPSPYFWTSTTNPVNAREAYYTNALDGHAWPWRKNIDFALRPVRSAGAEDPVAIFRTGQTRRYDGDRETAQPGGGDDGDLQLGLSRDYRWSDDGQIDTADENQVLDARTGLVWLRQPRRLDGSGGLGGNVDLSAPLDWQHAVEACKDLVYGGRDDWRLPNIRELDSLSRYGDEAFALDPSAFPDPPQAPPGFHQPPWIWWSSTTNVRERPGIRPQDEAWYVSIARPLKRHHVFDETVGTAKAELGHVRCLRDDAPRVDPEGWLPEVRSSDDWDRLSIETALPGVARLGKFLLPAAGARAEAPFAAAFQDTHRFLLHYDFLRATFADRFGSLTTADYEALVTRRETRRYFAGSLREFSTADGRRVYGFDVYVDPASPDELLSQAETAELHASLERAFRRRPLVYAPSQPEAAALALGWAGDWPPVAFPAPPPDPGYAAYTPGETYGRVRRMSLAELQAAGSGGALSWQDILVLDRAPTDVDGVVSGIVTGEPQGELSHLNVRAARRGTPNAYVAEAFLRFEPYEGQLVRLTLTRSGWFVEPGVDLAEAQAFWASRRPAPVAVPPVDASHQAIEDLATIAAGEAEAGQALSRVGAKAANLASLYTFLPAENQLPGLAIPFYYYLQFMASNRILDPALEPPVERSLAEHVAQLHADPRFQSDAVWRAERLSRLREAIRAGSVPDAWEAEIEEALRATFGPRSMVRFRSSSNAEDGLRFNGAGLYDSTSVCAEDGSDGDKDGPSRCDPRKAEERTIKRGLRKVWASLWNQRAWEERSWYGVDPLALGMAVLVTPAFPDERANGVAFTGNPLEPAQPAMLVNAQLGDVSVVLPEPGILPERDLLMVEDGAIAAIRRLQASSLMPVGSPVLSDPLLKRLGNLLLLADARFPLRLGDLSRQAVMLDLEFKVHGPDAQLYLKQVRPFLTAREPGAETPAFLRVTLPTRLTLCSGWRLPYPITDEFAERLRLQLPAGELEIPLDLGSQPGAVFGDLEAGPAGERLQAAGPSQIEIREIAGWPELREARILRRYRTVAPEGPDPAELELGLILTGLRAGEPNVRVLDAESLTLDLQVTAQAGERAAHTLTPCDLPGRPDVYLDFELEAGQRAELRLRYADAPGAAPVTQARLLEASVQLDRGERHLADPAQLTYDAGRHNWDERFWLRFDPPLGDAFGLEIAASGITGRPETAWTARLLDEDRRTLRAIAVPSMRRLDRPPAELPSLWLPLLLHRGR